MKQLLLLPFFICTLVLHAFAVNDYPTAPGDKKPAVHPMVKRMIACLSPAEFTQVTGRKLNLPQRIAYRLMRKKITGTLTAQQWQETADTLLLADGNTVNGIIVASKPGEILYKTSPDGDLKKADRNMVKGIHYAAAIKAFAKKEDEKEVPYEATASAALWLGLAGIVFLFLPYLAVLSLGLAVAAIVCGIIGLDKIKRSNGKKKGKGRATAGIVLGGAYFLLLVIVVVALTVALAGV